MSPELQALARRAVACKGWRWMPGMKIHDRTLDIRVFALLSDGLHVASTDSRGGFVHTMSLNRHRADLPIPDLTDPGTLGCLLALVREAHGQPHATVHWCWEFDANHPTHVAERGLPRRMWAVDDIHDWREASATSEAAALVAALEAAP